MDAAVRLIELADMHPNLLWDDIVIATAAVLADASAGLTTIELTVNNVPGFRDDVLQLLLDPVGISPEQIAKARRTFERSRLIELSAISIAGIGLHFAGAHEIQDVALRGTSADYLVDESGFLLEVSGRSRLFDFQSAWDQRWNRLTERWRRGFFVCVVEFETNTGRLAFCE